MKKVFLSDIDGTLIKTNTPVHKAAADSVRRFMESGGRFGLCTGRAASAASALAIELHVNLPCILLGGALIYDFGDKKALWKKPLDDSWRELVREIYKNEPLAGINICTETQIFSLRKDRLLRERGVAEDRDAPLSSLGRIDEKAYKILITHEEQAAFAHIAERYVDAARFNFCAASRHFYEITAEGVGKGIAAKRLLAMEGLQDFSVYAAGDGATDLALREAAEVFFAPETAPENVKAQADFLFPPPAMGGLASALEKVMTL